MKHLAVIDESKDFLAKFAYNIMYGRKFKKLNIDKKLSDSLIYRRKDSCAKDILNLINKSRDFFFIVYRLFEIKRKKFLCRFIVNRQYYWEI